MSCEHNFKLNRTETTTTGAQFWFGCSLCHIDRCHIHYNHSMNTLNSLFKEVYKDALSTILFTKGFYDEKT